MFPYNINYYGIKSSIPINGPRVPTFINNELKSIVKTLEENKIQINYKMFNENQY